MHACNADLYRICHKPAHTGARPGHPALPSSVSPPQREAMKPPSDSEPGAPCGSHPRCRCLFVQGLFCLVLQSGPVQPAMNKQYWCQHPDRHSSMHSSQHSAMLSGSMPYWPELAAVSLTSHAVAGPQLEVADPNPMAATLTSFICAVIGLQQPVGAPWLPSPELLRSNLEHMLLLELDCSSCKGRQSACWTRFWAGNTLAATGVCCLKAWHHKSVVPRQSLGVTVTFQLAGTLELLLWVS